MLPQNILMNIQVDTDRIFHDFPGTVYSLPDDSEEHGRLDHQHQVLKRAFGGVLLSPALNNLSNLSALDIGTGAGAWLLDLASQLPPSATLHGIDISSKAFPKKHPPNVSFSRCSITELPASWSGRFNVVHQRLLILGLARDDWIPALREVYRVVAPGGWVQLCEINGWHGGPAIDKLWSLILSIGSIKQNDMHIAEKLPKLLTDVGFVDIKAERRTVPLYGPSEQADQARANLLSFSRGMKTAALQAGGLGIVRSESDLDSLIAAFENECKDRESAGHDFTVIYGQKPTTPDDVSQ